MPKRVFRWNANGEGAQCNGNTDYIKVFNDYGHLWQGMKADNLRRHYQKLVAQHFNKEAVKDGKYLFIYTYNIKPIS